MSVERHAAAVEIEDEWRTLAARLQARPWLTPTWFDCWWRAFGDGELRLLACRRDDALVGVLPLVRSGRTLRSASNWQTPEFGMLAADASARAELVGAALAHRPARLSLWPLDPTDGGYGTLRAALEARKQPTLEWLQMRSPYVPLDDEHLAAYPHGKRRKELGRCRRRLAERGGAVAFDVRTGETDLGASLTEGFELEASGWKREQGTAILSSPQLVQFYTDLAHRLSAEGMLRLCFLRAGDKPVAFEFVLDDGRSLYDLKGGFDVEWRSCSPGFLIVWEIVIYGRAHGRTTLELLGDSDDFKLAFTHSVHERVRVESFAPTPAGVAGYAALRYGRPLAQKLARR